MDNVKNKTAIVTGAGSGIGYHITEDLLHKGAKKVAILDLPIERCYNATMTLQEKFGKDRVIFFPLDITNLEVYNKTFKQIVDTLNGLDILVNNAGICDECNIEQTFAINVVALIRGSFLGLDYMGKHKGGKGGTIVNIASVTGLYPFILCPVYSSSKYAVVGFGENLEKFYSKTGVRILTICPGFTETTLKIEGKFIDLVDKEIFEKTVNKFAIEQKDDIFKSQSALHVGQSVITAIQKVKNGSIWVVKNNEPPYPIKLQSFVAA